MKKIAWGVVSTGNIANQFAEGLSRAENCEIRAVCSRDLVRARKFARKHSIPYYFDSIQEMVETAALDIVYVGTPNDCHLDNVTRMIDMGMNILCEKPLGRNYEEAKQIVDHARNANVFLMEGMWTRFFPAHTQAMKWLSEGEIGRPKVLYANFGYDGSSISDTWRFDQSSGGGALLDVGIYPLAFAFAVFGADYQAITGAAKIRNGIDEYNAFILKYSDEGIALLSSSINTLMSNQAVIEGEKGRIIIHDNWWRPVKCELIHSSGDFFEYKSKATLFSHEYESTGFQFEAMAVNECLRLGRKESRIMPLQETLQIAKAMDRLRNQW